MTKWITPDGEELDSHQLLDKYGSPTPWVENSGVVWTDCPDCYVEMDKTKCSTCKGTGLVRDYLTEADVK